MSVGVQAAANSLTRKKSRQVNAYLRNVNNSINSLLDVTERVENDIENDDSQLELDYDDFKGRASKLLPEMYKLRWKHCNSTYIDRPA